MTHNELIDRAVAILKSRGWCQKQFENNLGEVCIIGALNRACDDPSDLMLEVFVIQRILARLGMHGESAFALGRWNDRASRTKEEVILALQGGRINE